MMKILISAEANLNARNNKGYIPLHTAVFSGNIEIIEVLIYSGSNINERTDQLVSSETGELTPLDLAKQRGNKKVIEFLISKGAR